MYSISCNLFGNFLLIAVPVATTVFFASQSHHMHVFITVCLWLHCSKIVSYSYVFLFCFL